MALNYHGSQREELAVEIERSNAEKVDFP